MANSDSPQGLVPVRDKNGKPYNGAGNLYHVAVGDAQVIAAGDPVLVTGTSDANGIPTVTRATAGATNYSTGVMMGLTNGEGTLTRDDGLVTTTLTSQYILVCDDPDVVFEAQCNVGFAVTDMSANADFVAAAANTLGTSQFEVDSTSFGVGNTKQLKVIGLSRKVNNEVGTNAKILVMFNLHSQRNALGV